MNKSRADVRAMKRQISCAAGSPERAQDALMALLERSIRFRHRRLAVQRLCDAVEAGAPVRAEHWCYCHEAMPPGDLALGARLERAARQGPARGG